MKKEPRASAVLGNSFVSKLSYMTHYFHAGAKCTSLPREYQFMQRFVM